WPWTALAMKWGSYKYRFVPWMWLNILKNQRRVPQAPQRHGAEKRLSSDLHLDIKLKLRCTVQCLFLTHLQRHGLVMYLFIRCLHPICSSLHTLHFHGERHIMGRHISEEPGRPVEVMRASLGFAVERAASSVPGAGTGVFVTGGAVPAHALVCLYPGTVYQKFEPVLFQSLGNPFMFCCLDGVLVDGRDRGLSRIVYR
uniref:Uncharacterized protein n=1 Tax=Petromyzon marinus TaxID=7757 RepID=S4RXF7_PETMA